MDLYSLAEGPLLRGAILIFLGGLLVRVLWPVYPLIRNGRGEHERTRWMYLLAVLGRRLAPLYRYILGHPIHAAFLYVFHLLVLILPIFLLGHIILWEESRFEWSWAALPDSVADGMTLVVLGVGALFFIRRLVLPATRRDSSWSDYLLVLVVLTPYCTGYFLTHNTLNSVSFLRTNIYLVHVMCGELMLILVPFLICTMRLRVDKCTGCGSCALECPVNAIVSRDESTERIIAYNLHVCVMCGACVEICPEKAISLRHRIGFQYLFHIDPKEVKRVELAVCEQCGTPFAPVAQAHHVGTKTLAAEGKEAPLTCEKCKKSLLVARFIPKNISLL